MSTFSEAVHHTELTKPETTRRNLHIIAALLKSKAITRNECALLKALAVREDERFNFIVHRFTDRSTTTEGFIDYVADLICDESFALFSSLFEDCSLEHGKNLSKIERKEKRLLTSALTYGEIDYFSFYRILRKLNLPRKSSCKFYDLGSGTSKAVFAARITQDFSDCVGIEILSNLHEAGVQVLEKYESEFRTFLYSGQNNDVHLHEGSVVEFDWSDGDVVFANSTCFDASLMAGISELAESLKPGSLIITFTKPITSDKFEQLSVIKFKMSWGPATVYTARRLAADGSTVCSLCSLSPEKEDDVTSSVNLFSNVPVADNASAAVAPVVKLVVPSKKDETASVFDKRPLDAFLVRFGVDKSCSSGRSKDDDDDEEHGVLDDLGGEGKEGRGPARGDTRAALTDELHTIDSLPPSALAAAAGEHIECIFTIPSISTRNALIAGTKKPPPIRTMKYLLRCPNANNRYRYDAESYVRTPLVVFLHGASARGSKFDGLRSIALPKWLDNKDKDRDTVKDQVNTTISKDMEFNHHQQQQQQQKYAGADFDSKNEDPIVTVVERGGGEEEEDEDKEVFFDGDIPALVLSPLCPQGREWKEADVSEIVVRLIDAVSTAYSVDTDRIYVTGISMGGLGAWMLAARNSEKFAAVAPMCGGGSHVYARLLRNTPFWFFHCESDNVVSITETEKLVHQLIKEGSEVVKFTKYSADECIEDSAAKGWMVGHNCWDKAYRTNEFWSWMLAQRKNIPENIPGKDPSCNDGVKA